jgi:carboxymethylenebutenolidase
MTKTIDYYCSLQSPWTYLGHQRLYAMATKYDAAIHIRPVDFATVFPATGGLPLPKRSPQRQAYRMQELKRWRQFLGLPLTLQPQYFPASERLAAGMVIALRDTQPEQALTLAGAVLRAVWAEERDIGDRATLLAIAAENALDGSALLAEAEQDKYSDIIARDSQAAISRGVFGAPSYVYDDEVFWGQDRLDFLERALAGGNIIAPA